MGEAIHKTRQGMPAWPTLLGVQGLVIFGLAVGFVSATGAREVEVSEVEQRLLAIDVPRAEAALKAALGQQEMGKALKDSDILRATSFLALSGQAAGLSVDDVTFEPVAVDANGAEAVEAVIDLSGDIYDLPIFVDGAHRQRAMGALQTLAFDVKPGGQARGRVRFRYHRPQFLETEWIGPRLALAAPGVAHATPALEAAASLIAWRAFNQGEPDRTQRAMQARARAARELPPNLVDLRASGGRFVWDAEAGIVIR